MAQPSSLPFQKRYVIGGKTDQYVLDFALASARTPLAFSHAKFWYILIAALVLQEIVNRRVFADYDDRLRATSVGGTFAPFMKLRLARLTADPT